MQRSAPLDVRATCTAARTQALGEPKRLRSCSPERARNPGVADLVEQRCAAAAADQQQLSLIEFRDCYFGLFGGLAFDDVEINSGLVHRSLRPVTISELPAFFAGQGHLDRSFAGFQLPERAARCFTRRRDDDWDRRRC